MGVFPDLENQMVTWEPGVGKSPDRIDALVHAVTALMVSPPTGMMGGKITASSPAGHKLPGTGGGKAFGLPPAAGARPRRFHGIRIVDVNKRQRWS
jgi:hypothetical protein